jgi:hypothetical protein
MKLMVSSIEGFAIYLVLPASLSGVKSAGFCVLYKKIPATRGDDLTFQDRRAGALGDCGGSSATSALPKTPVQPPQRRFDTWSRILETCAADFGR